MNTVEADFKPLPPSHFFSLLARSFGVGLVMLITATQIMDQSKLVPDLFNIPLMLLYYVVCMVGIAGFGFLALWSWECLKLWAGIKS